MSVVAIDIMSRLKDETAAQHKLAESSPFERALVTGGLPRPAYIEYLAQRLLIHTVLERAICELCESDGRAANVVTPNLLQEPNLRADLAFFQMDANEVEPRAASQRLIETIEEQRRGRPIALLGFYYVLEGSKNGARFIARAVGPAYQLSGGQGTRYLDPHGTEQRALWQEFRERMNAESFTPAEADAMVAAAGVMFEAVRELDDEIWRAMCG